MSCYCYVSVAEGCQSVPYPIYSGTAHPEKAEEMGRWQGHTMAFKASAQQCHQSLSLMAIDQSCTAKLGISGIGSTTLAQKWIQIAMKYFDILIFFQFNYKNPLKFLTYVLCTAPLMLPLLLPHSDKLLFFFFLAMFTNTSIQ